VEEGIMLPSNPLVNFIIKSAILRATKHHPINVSHDIVNGTHTHLIVRAVNPEDIPGFMERFKTESAHYLNRLLGRKKRTIWCAGYDSPRLMQVSDVIEKIAYLYTNPVKDGLVKSIKEYPGLSTYSLFTKTSKRRTARLIGRDLLFEVRQSLTAKGFKKIVKKLKESKKIGKLQTINIDTNDWMKAFNIEDPTEIKEINSKIKEKIKNLEEKYQIERLEKNKSFVGRETLENQGIDLTYIPKRTGKKMWCISSDIKTRKNYIEHLKSIAEEAREVYEQWKLGATALRMPIGVFAPRVPVLCNLI
jgi:REP element-mobilizing transposase RayT